MSSSEFDISFDLPKNQSNVIKVIGVGGGGSNAINHMFKQGIRGVDFVVCNTDAQALENSPVPTKLQLGVNLTEGLGAGANPEIGQQAAEESFGELKEMLDKNTKMVFITAGMGGGTGTGAAPIIAKQAKSLDLLTVGIVTSPFQFEGRRRNEQAQVGVKQLRENVDSLIVINNNKLREVYGNLGFKAGFSKADEVLATASRGIAEVITHHYTQNIDLRDAKTVLSNSGTAIMGSASASGSNRAQDAIMQALDSPLLNDNKITGSQNVLLLIVSGTAEITIDEIGEINDHIQAEAGHGANIIMGVGEDEEIEESISVTIIATGFDPEQQNDIVNTESKKIIHTLEDDQKATQDLSPKPESGFSPKINKPKKVYDLEDDPEEEKENKVQEPPEEKDSETDPQDFDEDEFVMVEKKKEENFENPVEGEEEKDPTQFEFDLPKKEDSPDETFEEPLDKKENEEPSDNQVVFHLGEEEDTQPSQKQSNEQSRKNRQPAYQKREEKTQQRNLNFPEPQLKKQQEEPKGGGQKSDEQPQDETFDPCEHPISDELINRASERRKKMKNFNYKFRKNSNIDEIEKQPAYKRAGMEVNEDSAPLKEKLSRTSVEEDEEGQPNMRKNNSYLHDNVD